MNSYDIIPVKNISSDLQQQWKDLSQRALQKNLYLCPEFVIPSLQLGDADPSLLAVWEPGTNRDRLAGLLIFEEHQPTANYPFRHAQLYQCVHAYLSGILLARESAVPVAAAMAAALAGGDLGVKALVFSDLSLRHSLADFCARRGRSCAPPC
jgi:hypothetical protein